MKKQIQGSVTIEAAVIVPLILLLFVIALHTLFYYHDKNILEAVAHETMALGSHEKALRDEELEEYFQSRIQGRLLLFRTIESKIENKEREVALICSGQKGQMSIRLERVMAISKPERYIRNVRKIEKIGEGVRKQE